MRNGIFDWNGYSYDINYADIRLRTAPTVTSTVFEIAIGRQEIIDGSPLFPENSVKLSLLDDTWGTIGDIVPNSGEFIDYEFDDTPVSPPELITFEKNDNESIRVITWNVEFDSIFEPDKQQSFQRIITALNPDIINFQEIFEHSEYDVLELINYWLPINNGTWYVYQFGDRTTVSRFPIISDWPEYYYPIDSRFTVVPIQITDEKKLIIFNTHLSCCNNDEDRQQQAESFIAYLRDLMTPGGVDLLVNTPFILIGDLNLVGHSQQLETLLEGEIINQSEYGMSHPPDWDETPLEDLISRQTEKRMAYTWRNDFSSYSPGRLDFIIYTNSVMSVDKNFIVYTPEMSNEQLNQYNLESWDSSIASDHHVVVADFVINSENNLEGDINDDGILNILDVVLMANMVFANEYDVTADVNEDGSLDVLDLVTLVNWLLFP